MNKIFSLLVVLAFLVTGSDAFALASGYSSAVTPTATGFGIKFASNGQPTATMNQTGTGVTVASQSIGLPLAGTVAPVIISASAAILGASMATPWGAALAAVGTTAMFAIPAFQAVYSALKMRANPTTGAIEKVDPSACTVAPCYLWQGDVGGQKSILTPSFTLACTQAMDGYRALLKPPDSLTLISSAEPVCSSTRVISGYSQTLTASMIRHTVDPSPATYISSSASEAQSMIATSAPTIAEVQALIDLNFPPIPSPPVVTGSSTWPMYNTVKALPTGGTETDACQYNLMITGANVGVQQSCVATVTAPGQTTTSTTVTNDTAGNPVSTATTTSSTAPYTIPSVPVTGTYNPQTAADAAAAPKPVQCGGDGMPACAVKVDESGMPVATDVLTQPVIDTYKPIKDFVNDTTSLAKPLPTINWNFALPSGCSVIPVTGAFADFIPSIDVCQFQPMFHNIMSMVWMLGGLFGAISLFMKSSLQE